jgi:hypothetical protein
MDRVRLSPAQLAVLERAKAKGDKTYAALLRLFVRANALKGDD